MAPQQISIRTLRTYTYRPLTLASATNNTPPTTAASSPIDGTLHIKGSKPTSRISKPARRSIRNMAWPSKQCAKTTTTSNTQLSAVLEDYLLLLAQQRDQVASRCSTREGTPASAVE